MGEWGILLQSYWLLILWDFRISFLPYRSWRQCLTPRLTPHSTPQNSAEQHQSEIAKTQHIRAIFDIATRNHYKTMNCLRRCMALQTLLTKNGLPSQLHIGVRMDEEKNMQAHSWLTSQGTLINDQQDNVDTYQKITHAETIFKHIK